MSRRMNTAHTLLATLVLVQAVTAGGFIAGTWDTHYIHTIGGSALPLIAVGVTVAGWLVARQGGWPRRSVILSAIATLVIWIETGLGHMPMPVTTAIHVPLGVALFGLLMLLGHPRSSVEPTG